MNILIAMNRAYHPQRIGGLESSTDQLAGALTALGHNVTVLCRIDPHRAGGLKLARAAICRPQRPLESLAARGYLILRSLFPCFRIGYVEERCTPDAVVIQSPGHLFGTKCFARLKGPIILHIRDARFKRSTLPIKPDLVIANSAFTARAFVEHYGVNAKFVPNIIDMDAYKVKPIGDKVLFVNPVPEKGVKLALRLAESNPDIPFIFVEAWKVSWRYRAWLKRRLREVPNVELRNRSMDMRSVYRMARLLIVPSQCNEAWGRVVSEAQVSGIPVLASNVGGLPASVGKGGVLLEPSNVNDWNIALREAYWDDERWRMLSAKARARVAQEDLDSRRIAERYAFLISSVVR